MTLPLALLLSALSGLVALSSELAWYRAWSFAAQGGRPARSARSSASICSASAAGSYLRRLRLCGERDLPALGRVVRGIALAVLIASLLGFLVTPAFALASRLGLHSAALPVVALTTTLMGAVFPLVSHAGVSPDDRAGSRVSYLYVANIVGSAVGSLLTGFVLMDVWSLRTLATAIALGGLALSLGVLLIARPSGREPRARRRRHRRGRRRRRRARPVTLSRRLREDAAPPARRTIRRVPSRISSRPAAASSR